jgi:di/tricarboxylate transporter
MKKKYDVQWIGLVLGLILPLLSVLIIYLLSKDSFLREEFQKTIIETELHIKLLSLCVIPNLLLFFTFIWTYRNYAARGVLMATFIYAIAIFAVKFLV